MALRRQERWICWRWEESCWMSEKGRDLILPGLLLTSRLTSEKLTATLEPRETVHTNRPLPRILEREKKAQNEWVTGGKELIYLGTHSLNIINLRGVSVLKINLLASNTCYDSLLFVVFKICSWKWLRNLSFCMNIVYHSVIITQKIGIGFSPLFPFLHFFVTIILSFPCLSFCVSFFLLSFFVFNSLAPRF